MSGIYIPGMEMPKSCAQCRCVRGCQAINDRISRMDEHPWFPRDHRHEDCPLIPVSDHGRLIDKDALEQDISDSVVFSGRDNNSEIYGANKIINRIHNAPTIIEAEEEHTMDEFMYGQEGNPNDGSM